MTVLLLCALLYVLLLFRAGGWRGLWRRPWTLFMGASLAVTIASRTNIGGNLNTLILGYALLCLGPGLLAAELARRHPSAQGQAPPPCCWSCYRNSC
jgi:hypothetical protein